MNDTIEGLTHETNGRLRQAAGEARTQADGLYRHAAGDARRVWGQAQVATDQVSGAIRAQPLIAAAVAAGIGYLLGRLTA